MRPLFNNEIVKLDIKNIACSVCSIRLQNWDHVIEHLELVHGVTLMFKNKMIPYELDSNSCALCSRDFSAFMLLDSHMNTHYGNYVCRSCGDSFATEVRLKAHAKIHATGNYPCPVCNKMFPLQIYMKKHVTASHSDKLKFKCFHCDVMFKSEYKRHSHVVKCHAEYAESITCELCGKMFDWMKHFIRHMKRKHASEYNCVHCGRFFESKKALMHHEVTHTGVKQFTCLVCRKSYYSNASLKSHMKYLHKNIKL